MIATIDSAVTRRGRFILTLALGINSFATLVFETVLLKQLSFLLGSWDFLLSVVLCSFMIGAGIGALFFLNKRIRILPWQISLAQAACALVTFVILLQFDVILSFSSDLVFVGLCLSPPFILFGYLVTALLDEARLNSQDFVTRLYAADLGGAAIGGVLSVFTLLPILGINKASILCVLLFVVSSALFIHRSKLRFTLTVCVAGLILASLLLVRIDGFIEKHRGIRHTPLYTLLQDGGRQLYTGWSPLQRIDVVSTSDNLVLAYNGFPWTSFNRIEDPFTIDSVLSALGPRYLKGAYPFLTSPRNVLVIGAGAGPDLFYSRLWAGEKSAGDTRKSPGRIVGVEIDPLVVDLMRGRFAAFNKRIYCDPQVEIVTDDGRHFLETTSGPFDLIHYPGVDTPFAYANVLGVNPYLRAENFLYTYEGLQAAYDKLSDDGVLIVTVGNWYPDAFGKLDFDRVTQHLLRESRLLATYKRILEYADKQPWTAYVEMVGYAFPHGSSNSMVDVMLKIAKKPVDYSLSKRFISDRGMSYPAHFFETSRIEELARMSVPATDDRPFYYNFPLNDIPRIISRPLYFFAVLLAVFFLFVVFLFKFIKKADPVFPHVGIFLLFVLVGISFMMAELLYAHQAVLFLGNSFVGIAVFVPIMLFLSGAGSLVAMRTMKNFYLLLFACVVLVVWAFTLHRSSVALHASFINASLYVKAAVFSLLCAPIGISLGLFFPLGFIMSQRLNPAVSAGWVYSLDILGSIVGILVGVCLPLQYGYQQSMYYLSFIFVVQSALLVWLRCIIW